ncbi:MAG: hypothetical protein ACK4RG_07485 [Fimbriimonadales bacterium]
MDNLVQASFVGGTPTLRVRVCRLGEKNRLGKQENQLARII